MLQCKIYVSVSTPFPRANRNDKVLINTRLGPLVAGWLLRWVRFSYGAVHL